MADDMLRDDPPTPRPRHAFQVDVETFRHTLARLPAVRNPWLRETLHSLTHRMYTRLV
ncbi:hypothetical protein [Streptomyces sp. 142MFCol3.1]|uniref:hypothetical protein n=1 Tax=Streptomyces sp. 142MFCol3.1 TaxID=1172179 RepID=UPI0004019EBC